VVIADNGTGIQPADLNHIFEPFYTTKADIGTGLGLWVSHAIVQKHGGRIRVRSRTAVGNSGTVFSVFLPVAIGRAATN
jgi:signal transduction histidine kinase